MTREIGPAAAQQPAPCRGSATRIWSRAVNDSLYAEALAPFLAETARLRPPGTEVIDAHTHLGLDEDGRSLTLEQLLGQLDAAEARRACVFPLHDPDRHPSYRVPNDRVLAWAGESDGRLVPFCRLDPAEDPRDEAERCLAAGARGIKLHPRAQAFVFDGPEMESVFAIAEEASVPILIHAGRGLPPLADGLADLALRHPGAVLILAHGAICDQGILTTRLAEHPGVLYDISCFFPLDVIELFARVPAERIVFASDPAIRDAGDDALPRRARCAPGAPRRADDQADARRHDGLAASTATVCRPSRRRGVADRSRCRAGWRGCTATRASSARRCSPARASRRDAMLDMALAACRDPQPGADGEALETIGAALGAAEALVGRAGRRARGDRPRVPRDRARGDRGPRRAGRRRRLIADPIDAVARSPTSHTAAHSPSAAPCALAHTESARRTLHDLVDLGSQQTAGDQPRRRVAERARQARAAAGTAGWRAP